ncbi:ABC transporter substrate-binding protein [Actinomadura madurae]|uniref:heme/hemin ABC transporter substrate-binding protein n=1 Tax=Actinomadura madurae TaxID=1993 RepID=UPI00202657BC|nr:ABC transporter substrate-binding protein [Actinomadura madurae]URM96681.1 ABC transporter substrate-binding protein [Actinomadura madurae]
MIRPLRSLGALLALGCVLPLTACGDGTAASGPGAASGCELTTVAAPAGDPEPAGGTARPELPVTVRSADGTMVTVRDARRVLAVDLYGSLAEIVYGLGLGDRLVGRDISTTFPAARALPLVTTQGHDLSAEAILKLDPSVVLAGDGIGPPEVLGQLRSAGVPVVLVKDRETLDAIGPRITAAAAALGVPGAGRRLATRVGERVEAAARAVPSGDRPRVAFLYVRGSAGVYLIGGEGAGPDAMIEAAGGTDAGTAIGLSGFRPLTSEGMINAAPDVLLVLTAGLRSVGGVTGLLKLPGVAQTPAGRNRRIVRVDDGALLSFGSRTAETIGALATALRRTCR